MRRPNHAPTLKKSQVDVFPLVFVSADNINVSARLTTDLFIKKTGSASFMPPTQKQHTSALTLMLSALTNNNGKSST